MDRVRARVEQTPLPGISVRHDLITSSGRTVGVVSHRSGRRDLVLYDVDDPMLARLPDYPWFKRLVRKRGSAKLLTSTGL